MKITNISKLSAFLLGFVLLSTDSHAFHWFKSKQAIPPRTTTSIEMPRFDRPERSTSAPFDGGLGVLIAAGVAYASKKGLDKRKKIKEANQTL